MLVRLVVDRRLGDGILDVIFFACHVEDIPLDEGGLRGLKGLVVTMTAE